MNNYTQKVNSIYTNGNFSAKDYFVNCSKYRNIVIIKIDANITSSYQMFKNCSYKVEIDLSHFDASHVTNMGYMFEGCTKLTSINFNNFDTSNVT